MSASVMPSRSHRHRRNALLVALVGTTALSLQCLVVPGLWDAVNDMMNGVGVAGRRQLSQLTLLEEIMLDHHHSIVLDEEILGEMHDEEILAIPGEDDAIWGSSSYNVGKAATIDAAVPSTSKIIPHAELINSNQPLPAYTIEDALESSKTFANTFGLLVYYPDEDAFIALYSRRHYWVAGCNKLIKSFKSLVYLLRNVFPERFQGKKSKELVIPISSSDYPGIRNVCFDHFRRTLDQSTPPGWKQLVAEDKNCYQNVAPVLHFGSVFRQPHFLPNMISMPMPADHSLPCFSHWIFANKKSVCRPLRPAGQDRGALMWFGDEQGLKWEELIPQVVWRGTDFTYLHKIHPHLQRPSFRDELIAWPHKRKTKDKVTIAGLTASQAAKMERRLESGMRARAPKRAQEHERKLKQFSTEAAVIAMREEYDKLAPRWKAVVLTAEAEVQADSAGALPWANMKISHHIFAGKKISTVGAPPYKGWEGIGFPATGEYMDFITQANYKYHIDLGGGGGTTWTGTAEKLALPGLLFHHMTPTKDYIHDWMKPWVHYVPISEDLKDLKSKFDWAENNPEKAKQIADQGTQLMKYLTSREGFGEMFQQDMMEPLRRVIEAYQPVSTDPSNEWRRWRPAIQDIAGKGMMRPTVKCTGNYPEQCVEVTSDYYMKKNFQRTDARSLFGDV
mmetsp:Transcript_39501/g.83066  ORF Transcript_39501/g.83066 Transcript_39501/m.83066 type:complete len:676 (-) Transcript_39501:67-2094(-)